MKRIQVNLVFVLFAIGWMGGTTLADGQAVQMRNGVVFEEGEITVGEKHVEAKSNVVASIDVTALANGLSGVYNNAFACTPVHPLKKGDTLAADISNYEIWGREHAQLSVGTYNVKHPILGLVAETFKDKDGSEYFKYVTVYPTVCKAKTDIKAGVALHSSGYVIETSRSVKAGDSIPAVCVYGDEILSVGAGSEARPWFTAFPEGTKSDPRSHAIEVWNKEKDAP